MNDRRLTVRTRLIMAFGLLTCMVVLVSLLGIVSLGNANAAFENYVNGTNARANLVDRVRVAVDRRAIAARNQVLATGPRDADNEKEAALQADREVGALLGELTNAVREGSGATDKARELVRQIGAIEAQYGPVARAIVEAAANNRRDQAVTMINEQCRPLLAQLVAATDAYATYSRSQAAQLVQESNDRYTSRRLMLIAICIAAVAAAAISGLFITRGLLRSLGTEPAALSDIAGRIAAGDLGTEAATGAAPAGSVLASMREMQANLVRLISAMRTASGNVATGAAEIAAGNQDLSSRTEEQAASLQETASSMEQLTSTVRLNADNAQQASGLADNASEVAQRGSVAVGLMVDTMTDISTSSAKIAEITAIIEGIAFQTNILALNAAVEAARAGEQGRGFAVVASEVRSLAQRSSSAAKDIRELISQSVRKIQDGSHIASNAGDTMNQVTHAISRVTDIMGEIAAASNEQSRGIEQVNLAITQMDEVTQQNAALVEQAAAASKSLEEQGNRLAEAVSQFRLDTRTAGA
ncbi:TPA: MCP four helix bundle domain-containing protein [Burkholderia aenigmatica]|uniref:methyl-accepting chemotaxis protein n=1 Tax=Burkholderia sp. AU45251 TaxID=3059204 RepID=UPI00264DF14F|nr:methyl-accepting chemotaxis protein [Burkholderia sp. AU45251]HDR9483187.1 MCP four helix bundle domain-containing protein [Burkholderia aenigmatica]MDN7516052.1 methyl-accepting chemotaxis protein [Burkholderia sp. AU45251]HDR9514135.1 MCP four helix bundle domain-containing protein [Burkholderia aenigmatica]HDR9591525.1 MCP four helix bundle domain-containing protein [Burkholderia aenigmatica]HDR9598617.1 MCP four helix bundle domain-containing protein [Burkholderia aenigmatica]